MSIIVKDLSKSFHQANLVNHVLCKVSFHFEKGKTYALTGPSGSGKSTLLHLLGKLIPPTSGTVKFTSHIGQKNKNHSDFGIMFQDDYLLEQLSVLENVAIAGIINGMGKKQAINEAKNLLTSVGMSKNYNYYPTKLSGGQRSRVALCRALVCKPAFLLADEPTGNLDQENAKKVIDLVLSFQKQFNMGVIICTHDSNVSSRMETILKIENGKLTTLDVNTCV